MTFALATSFQVWSYWCSLSVNLYSTVLQMFSRVIKSSPGNKCERFAIDLRGAEEMEEDRQSEA